MKRTQTIGVWTATVIVIANMIGTGIFTSLGLQLEETTNTWSILLLWILGAVMAICGALSYAELGTFWKRSGGEYHFLSKAFHPMLGYLSGWVSITIGFAAPIALSAMALAAYVGPYTQIPDLVLALGAILVVSLLHSISIRRSGLLQNTTTIFKVLLILIFIGFGLFKATEASAFEWSAGWRSEILLPAFAVSFVYVTFSYSGWNAAVYIADEIRDVRRNLPRAILMGTLVVSTLYLLLNLIFLKHNPLASLQGELEVGQLTAISIFGEGGGELISFGIGLMLISSISAMVWAGPRVTQVLGEDHRLWRWFSRKTKTQVPMRAIWLQTTITIILLLSGTFEQVMIYSGFVLQLFAALAVAAVFVARKKDLARTGFKSPLYPWPQLFFLAASLWVLVYLILAQPLETGLGALNLVLGFLVYRFDKWYGLRKR